MDKWYFCSASVAASLFIGTSSWAQVQRPLLISEPAKKAQPLSVNNQYAFEIRCTPGKPLQDPSDLFTQRNRSLFVLITPNPPSSVDKLPADALAAVQVYTIGKDSATKQQILSDDRDCTKDFLVNGSKNVGIVVTDNWIDNYSDSSFGQVLSGSLSLVSPLFSLFTGGPVPALIAGKITNAGSVQTSVQNILTALNRGVNYTHPPIRKLRVGTYVVLSEYASVKIKIRAVGSIVLDKNPAFKNDLKDQVNAASIKLDSSKIDTSCRGARYDISSLGFRSPIDLAYGLVHLSAHAGFSIKDSVSCLTPEYATVAAAADNRFWSNFPPDFRIKPADVEASSKKSQPTWDSVRKTLYTLVVSLARYARNNPPPESAIAALSKLLMPQVAVVDNTTSMSIGDNEAPVDKFDAIKKLTEKGYIRFGCYAPTDTTTDQQVDGATSMFLVFKAPSDAVSTSIDSALVIRPQFMDDAAKTFMVSDNRAWIVATLNARGYECNGFSVIKPASVAVK